MLLRVGQMKTLTKCIALLITVVLFIILWKSLATNNSIVRARPSSCYGNRRPEIIHNGTFQAIGSNNSLAYVYSAYLDDRPAPDVVRLIANRIPVVRIFTWFDRHAQFPLNEKGHWRCVFWNREMEPIGDVEVASWTDTNYYDTQSEIVRAMLICPVNSSNQSTTSNSPFAVSVLTESCQLPTNVLMVSDLVERRQRTANFASNTEADGILPVGDKTSKLPNAVSFAVCVKPIHNTSLTVEELIEFIEVNRVFGAELFYFYVDSSVDELFRRCIREYERTGLVESTPWRLPVDIDSHVPEKGQFLALTECGYRLMYRTKYLAMIDFDEFIVPTQPDNWQSMLALINADSKLSRGHSVASYSFRNRFFPLPDKLHRNLPTYNHAARPLYRTLGQISGQDYLFPWKIRSKVIGAPERLLRWHNHEILDVDVVAPGDRNLYVDDNHAVMHHYRRNVASTGLAANYTRMLYFDAKARPSAERLAGVCSVLQGLQ